METHSQYRDDMEFFKTLRDSEYSLLDQQGQVYLDYTGGNLCPSSLLKQHFELLNTNILGNPHSTNPTSQKATKLVEEARKAIIDFFHAEDYYCVFTANASGALKVIGESYPFDQKSTFIILSDNHNSVNGIREFCTSKGGTAKYAKVHYEDLTLDETHLEELFAETQKGENNLFAFPAQSNVSGVKHDLDWINKAHEKGFDVLLDAAAFVPTSKLDLSVHKPDYVSISFYKIFGFPTGIGCLLIKKSKFDKLKKPWFAGGTVSLVSVVSQNKILARGAERYEDGTLNYNMIPSIKFGLDYINTIGYDRISRRVKHLIQYLYNNLSELRHENGSPLVKIFGTSDFTNRGGNIILNFLDDQGHVIPFQSIEEKANQKKISIRSGCFCNPGIDEINNHITNDDMSNYFSSKENGDYYDMVAFLGKMRGAIRVSVGLATNQKDLDQFLAFAKSVELELEV